MLAVGPAWHPLPFPSSPCLGRQPAPSPPPPPFHPPPHPPLHWNCKEDQNKERGLFFTRLLLWPNDITSAASSPQIPAAQHIFPSRRRRPSILFEFHHFKPFIKADEHLSLSLNNSSPSLGVNPFRKSNTYQTFQAANVTNRSSDVIRQSSPNFIRALIAAVQICV